MAKLPQIPVLTSEQITAIFGNTDHYKLAFTDYDFKAYPHINDIMDTDEIVLLSNHACMVDATQLAFFVKSIDAPRACFISDEDYCTFVRYVESRKAQEAYRFFRKSLAPTGTVYFDISDDMDCLICIPVNEAYYTLKLPTFGVDDAKESIEKLIGEINNFYNNITLDAVIEVAKASDNKIIDEVSSVYGIPKRQITLG